MPVLDPDTPVRHLRELAGLSTRELAQRLGRHQPHVVRSEKDDDSKLSYLARVAEACGFRLEIRAVRERRKIDRKAT